MSLIAATPGGSAQFLAGNIVADGIVAASLVGQQDNFAPDGIQGATLVSMRLSEALAITGMLAAGALTIRWLKNDSVFVATLVDQSGASSAANRFNLGGANLTLAAGLSAGFVYNGLTARWDLFTVGGNAAAPPSGSVIAFGPAATFVTVAGDNNDVTPAPVISTINRIKFNTAAGAATVTGIAAGSDGQGLLVTNTGANDLTLAVENAGSAAVNRLYGIGDLVMPQFNSQLLVYDATLTRWLIA